MSQSSDGVMLKKCGGLFRTLGDKGRVVEEDFTDVDLSQQHQLPLNGHFSGSSIIVCDSLYAWTSFRLMIAR